MGALSLVGDVFAQQAPQVELKIAPAPYYVGVAIDLHLQVEGLEASPEPSCTDAAVDGGRLSLVAIVPNISTQVTIINGRTSRTDRVTFVCRFSLTVARPGEIRLGPFLVAQGAVRGESPIYSIQARTLAPDPRVRIRLVLPEGPIYVGQRLPVGIEWWIDEEIQETIQNYEIRSQLFEMPDTFRFVDDRPANRGEQTLTVQTPAGENTFSAAVETVDEGGRTFLVVRAQRTLIPLRSGSFDLPRATVGLNEVTRWQRDFFGGRRPAQTRRIFGNDVDRRLVVRDAPLENRPGSYGGAIGRGFSFEVTADRSVVQRGDPILLTFTVRGEGGLEHVGLSGLEGALHPNSFTLPSDQPSGEIADGAKIFRVPVRILDESLEEIPALPYSWFDPSLGEYQTVYSRPIALSVRPAQLISAADVVAAQPGQTPASRKSNKPEAGRSKSSGPGDFSLTGANLAIELDRDRLRGARKSRGQRLGVLYVASLLMLTAAFLYRRRSDRDPEILRVSAGYKEQIRRIDAAASLPRKEALGQIASALRELGGLGLGGGNLKREALIAECDAVFYAPDSGSGSPVEAKLIERARTLARELGSQIPGSGAS
jgi:hypothetical protein